MKNFLELLKHEGDTLVVLVIATSIFGGGVVVGVTAIICDTIVKVNG